MRSATEYSRQAEDEMQKRREREQRKREPDKMPAPRAVSCCLMIKINSTRKMHSVPCSDCQIFVGLEVGLQILSINLAINRKKTFND